MPKKYSELTNQLVGGYLGEGVRMGTALTAVRIGRGKDFKFVKFVEAGFYTVLQEALEDWLKSRGYTVKQLLVSFIDNEIMVQAALGVQKWFLILLVKYACNMFTNKAKFTHEAMDYALAVGLREAAGMFSSTDAGWMASAAGVDQTSYPATAMPGSTYDADGNVI